MYGKWGELIAHGCEFCMCATIIIVFGEIYIISGILQWNSSEQRAANIYILATKNRMVGRYVKKH